LSFVTANAGAPSLGSTPLVFEPVDIDVGISDINIGQGTYDTVFSIDDGLSKADQVQIVSSNVLSPPSNPDFVSSDIFLDKALDNHTTLNDPRNKIRHEIAYKGELNPYQAVSFDSIFSKIVKYKYDVLKDITTIEMIEQ